MTESFFRKGTIKDWKRRSEFPLFEGLLLAYVYHKMRKLFNEIHEPQIAEEYEELRNKMDDECTELLGKCFREVGLDVFRF